MIYLNLKKILNSNQSKESRILYYIFVFQLFSTVAHIFVIMISVGFTWLFYNCQHNKYKNGYNFMPR